MKQSDSSQVISLINTVYLFHGFSTAHNADTAVTSLIFGAFIVIAGGCHHYTAIERQLVQALLNDQTNQTVGVKFEIGPTGVSADRTNT